MEEVKEIWKKVKGYEGLYSVSNLGRIYSRPRFVKGKNGTEYWKKGRFLKPQTNPKGYLFVNLCKDGYVKLFLVHRLVAIAFIPNPLNLPLINHKDGIKKNIKPDNLEWSTESNNVQHSYDMGLQSKRGVKTSNTILNEDLVVEIRNKFSKEEMTKKELAKKYRVSLSSIYSIISRRTWNWEGI